MASDPPGWGSRDRDLEAELAYLLSEVWARSDRNLEELVRQVAVGARADC